MWPLYANFDCKRQTKRHLLKCIILWDNIPNMLKNWVSENEHITHRENEICILERWRRRYGCLTGRGLSEPGETADWAFKISVGNKGINEKTYYYWQRRLREAACERLTSEKLSPQKESRVFAAFPIPSSRDSASIVIRLNGVEVEIRDTANTAAVETVLKVLRGS